MKYIAAQLASLIGMLLMGLIIGPLAEEFGWRGFALDPLQARWSALISVLIIGVFWWAWHFPLFFMNGMLQNEWGVGTVAFWAYAVTVFSLSVLFTLVFNNTRRSILAAILLHTMNNSTLNVLSHLSDRVTLITAGILALVAVTVVFIWGAKTLARHKTQTKKLILDEELQTYKNQLFLAIFSAILLIGCRLSQKTVLFLLKSGKIETIIEANLDLIDYLSTI